MGINLPHSKFLRTYAIGQTLHIVDFDKQEGHSGMGEIVAMTDQLIICKMETGYKLSISFPELKCKRYGVTIVKIIND